MHDYTVYSKPYTTQCLASYTRYLIHCIFVTPYTKYIFCTLHRVPPDPRSCLYQYTLYLIVTYQVQYCTVLVHMLFLLLLLLLLSHHTALAVYSQVKLDAWNIHKISRTTLPPSDHTTTERRYQITLASSHGGDADLFVAHCGMSVDDVVLDYIGYSFTHGIDLVELPMYSVVQIHDDHLCAYVLGKSTEIVEYELLANVVHEEDNIVEQMLVVSTGTAGRSSYGSPSSGEYGDGDEYESSSFSPVNEKVSTWGGTFMWWIFFLLEHAF